jgi:hypothetical protein
MLTVEIAKRNDLSNSDGRKGHESHEWVFAILQDI